MRTELFIPTGWTEQQVLDVMDSIVNSYASKFAFAYFDTEDIKQEMYIIMMEAMPLYDNKRCLRTFLSTVCYTRTLNIKRRVFRRADAPCTKCHKFALEERQAGCREDVVFCAQYKKWFERNFRKAALASPSSLEAPEALPGEQTNTDHSEIFSIIDQNLDISLREDYLRLKEGCSIPTSRKQKVMEAIREIMEEYDIDY